MSDVAAYLHTISAVYGLNDAMDLWHPQIADTCGCSLFTHEVVMAIAAYDDNRRPDWDEQFGLRYEYESRLEGMAEDAAQNEPQEDP